ncbi:MAG: GNAT family N-acetyltransferase [Terriglobales bacterium]|jgi:predicted GNAT superfamily acetyltransferase
MPALDPERFQLRHYPYGKTLREIVLDYELVRSINQQAVPHVSSLAPDELKKLAAQCFHFAVASVGSACAGFLMALRPGEGYGSLNYRWFSEHYANFVYIDRIAIASEFQGRGVGRALYADVEQAAKGLAPILTCEVNLVPPNPGSMAFHAKLAFAEVDQMDGEDGAKRVSLMVKAIRV